MSGEKYKKGRGVSHRGPSFIEYCSLCQPISICQNLSALWVGARRVFELLESSELASP